MVVTGLSSLETAIASVCNKSGIRYFVNSSLINFLIYFIQKQTYFLETVLTKLFWLYHINTPDIFRYCAVRPGDSLTKQESTVSWWRQEPRLTVLILAGLDSGSSSLDLSSADLLVTVDTGPGHWEPVLECPLVRLVAEGTVEEGLTRLETVRKILQDIKSKAENVMLSKQTVTDILNPTPDNGYTKKKEKVHRIVLD